MKLSLNQIQTFLAVAETRSFRKASELRHLSQPAVSAHISELEATLKVALLNRTTRHVSLTDAGERFRVRAARAISELDDVTAELLDEARMQRGRVVVACIPTIASGLLSGVIADFRSRFPGIAVEVRDEIAADVRRRVERAEADFGIGPPPERNHNLDFRSIAQDEFVAVFPVEHALSGRTEVPLRDVMQYPLLITRVGTNVRELLETACARSKLRLQPTLEVDNHFSLGGMVRAGLGITMLPSMAVPMLSEPRLRTARVVAPVISRQIGILNRKGQHPSPAAAAFIELIAAGFADYRASKASGRRARTRQRPAGKR